MEHSQPTPPEVFAPPSPRDAHIRPRGFNKEANLLTDPRNISLEQRDVIALWYEDPENEAAPDELMQELLSLDRSKFAEDKELENTEPSEELRKLYEKVVENREDGVIVEGDSVQVYAEDGSEIFPLDEQMEATGAIETDGSGNSYLKIRNVETGEETYASIEKVQLYDFRQDHTKEQDSGEDDIETPPTTSEEETETPPSNESVDSNTIAELTTAVTGLASMVAAMQTGQRAAPNSRHEEPTPEAVRDSILEYGIRPGAGSLQHHEADKQTLRFKVPTFSDTQKDVEAPKPINSVEQLVRTVGTVGYLNMEKAFNSNWARSKDNADAKKRLDELQSTGNDAQIRAGFARETSKGVYQDIHTGKELDPAIVRDAQIEWLSDPSSFQAAFWYELNKSANEGQFKNTIDRAVEMLNEAMNKKKNPWSEGRKGANFSESDTIGILVGVGFMHKPTHLSFKHAKFEFRVDPDTGVRKLHYTGVKSTSYAQEITTKFRGPDAANFSPTDAANAASLFDKNLTTMLQEEKAGRTDSQKFKEAAFYVYRMTHFIRELQYPGAELNDDDDLQTIDPRAVARSLQTKARVVLDEKGRIKVIGGAPVRTSASPEANKQWKLLAESTVAAVNAFPELEVEVPDENEHGSLPEEEEQQTLRDRVTKKQEEAEAAKNQAIEAGVEDPEKVYDSVMKQDPNVSNIVKHYADNTFDQEGNTLNPSKVRFADIPAVEREATIVRIAEEIVAGTEKWKGSSGSNNRRSRKRFREADKAEKRIARKERKTSKRERKEFMKTQREVNVFAANNGISLRDAVEYFVRSDMAAYSKKHKLGINNENINDFPENILALIKARYVGIEEVPEISNGDIPEESNQEFRDTVTSNWSSRVT